MIRVICRTLHIPFLPAHSPDGPVVLYTAAQVVARKARWARIGAAMLVCTVAGGGYQAARHAPPGWLGLPDPLPAIHEPVPLWHGLPPAPVWRATGEPVRVPEPPTWPLLGGAAMLLGIVVRIGRGA